MIHEAQRTHGQRQCYASREALTPDTRRSYVAPMTTNAARTTLGDLQRATPWVWLYCQRCSHYAPIACAVPVIRWGADLSSDKLRQCARCTACGHKGEVVTGDQGGVAAGLMTCSISPA